jgi:hypothetical protein
MTEHDLSESRVRVLFLVHLIEAWDSCHDVVRAMKASPDFDPVVVSIPRHFNGDLRLNFEEEVHRGLEREGVEHLRLPPRHLDQAAELMRRIAPHLIFRQSQWDADIPDVFSAERLAFAHLCLIPYETMNIVKNVANELTANSAVDSTYHRRAWVVFCANTFVLDMARRDGAGGGAQFRVAGHPKADRLRTAQPRWPVAWAPATRSPRVAWSAHHSIGSGWTDFGAFPMIADGMLAWATERPDLDFVFLPHPALVPYTGSSASPITRTEFDRWQTAWHALPNTATSAGGGYGSVLAASDLLVTDGLSLLVEYQLLQKPLLFFERDAHRPFNEIGEMVRRGAHTVTTVPEVRALADRFLRGDPDPNRALQRENVDRLFGEAPSAPRILAILREMIAEERARSVLAHTSTRADTRTD